MKDDGIPMTFEITHHVWRETSHAVRKLRSTIKILYCLGMARTFGEYQHTIWDGTLDYAVYRWRNQCWAIPTQPMEPPQ